jgi:hypothetical protein
MSWMIGRPRLLHKKQLGVFCGVKQFRFTRFCQRVLLATFSNSLHRKLTLSSDWLFHFDPFGTEFCEPGRVDHPNISDLRLPIAE